MNRRSLLAALLLTVFGAMPSEAAYSFVFNAAPPPGPGGHSANVYYQGPNNVNGEITVTTPGGIFGLGTPSNSGSIYSDGYASFQIIGSSSGGFTILGNDGQIDFGGNISNPNVGATGGSFLVNGFLSPTVASFFGLPTSTPLMGVVSLQLSDPGLPGGYGNKIGSLSVTLVAGPAIGAPEPASLIETGTGLAIAFGFARVRRRRMAH